VGKLTLATLFVSVGGAWCAVTLVHAQAATKPDVPKSVWAGIYSPEQARRGDTIYFERCVDCHAEDLSGASPYQASPSVAGNAFKMRWKDKELDELFTKIRRDMPRDKPGTLTTEEALDVMAFILQANEYPEGTTPLTDDVGRLREIRMPIR
jgi:cytochrome c